MQPYSPDEIVINWGGADLSAALAKGVFVKIGRNEDSATLSVGSTGEATVVLNRNKSGRCVLTVMMDSAVNEIMSARLALFEQGLGGIEPLLLKSLRTGTLYHAENAWLVKAADGEYSNEDTTREYTLETDKLEVFISGAPS